MPAQQEDSWRKLSLEPKLAFAREFKAARAAAMLDTEAYGELIFTMERFGSFLTNGQSDLAGYRKAVRTIAADSGLAFAAAAKHSDFHQSFSALYEYVRHARNDAMHQGVAARQLSRHAQELALIMEDALMASAKAAKDFMVREPVCAAMWQPLSAIRRTMLLNSFSFLPYERTRGNWRLIADRNLVQFLRGSDSERKSRLLLTLEEAFERGLEDTEPYDCEADARLSAIVPKMNGIPTLVLSEDRRLIGIITEFDLL